MAQTSLQSADHDNQIFEALADLFVNDEIICELRLGASLRSGTLDYSVESLGAVDEYLQAVHESPGSEEDDFRSALRSGAYLGEVLRRNTATELNWVQFDRISDAINAATNGAGEQLSTFGVLVSQSTGMTFPIGKAVKYLANGSEDSTQFFARAMLHSWANGSDTRQQIPMTTRDPMNDDLRLWSNAQFLGGIPREPDRVRTLFELWFEPWTKHLRRIDGGARFDSSYSVLDTLEEHGFVKQIHVIGLKGFSADIRLQDLLRAADGTPSLGSASVWAPENSAWRDHESILVEQLVGAAAQFRAPFSYVTEWAPGDIRADTPGGGFRGRQKLHMNAYRADGGNPKRSFGLSRGLSGLAWRTVLGPDLVNFIGTKQLKQLPKRLGHEVAESVWLLTPCATPDEWQRNTLCDGEAEIISILGADKFFNPATNELPTMIPTLPEVAPYPVTLTKIMQRDGRNYAGEMSQDEVQQEQHRWYIGD